MQRRASASASIEIGWKGIFLSDSLFLLCLASHLLSANAKNGRRVADFSVKAVFAAEARGSETPFSPAGRPLASE